MKQHIARCCFTIYIQGLLMRYDRIIIQQSYSISTGISPIIVSQILCDRCVSIWAYISSRKSNSVTRNTISTFLLNLYQRIRRETVGSKHPLDAKDPLNARNTFNLLTSKVFVAAVHDGRLQIFGQHNFGFHQLPS